MPTACRGFRSAQALLRRRGHYVASRSAGPFPSYTDPDHELAQSFGAIGLPGTAFLDRSGKLVWLKQGNYRDGKELEAEIKRYALDAS